MPRLVRAAPGVVLWSECLVSGSEPEADPLLLVADAGASGLMWPDELVAGLAEQCPVIRYDHRDTGRSRAFADHESYGVAELAADAVAVLDAYGVDRAHVLGWGVGGLVAQLLLLDHPARTRSVVLLGTGPLPGTEGAPASVPPLALTRLWAEVDDPRDRESELAWRLAHDRILHGSELPFDAAEFRARHERAIEHAGTDEPLTAHLALPVPARGAELPRVEGPVLVVEAPADPLFPPPSSSVLAGVLPHARLVRVPGLGHTVGAAAAHVVAELVATHMSALTTST